MFMQKNSVFVNEICCPTFSVHSLGIFIYFIAVIPLPYPAMYWFLVFFICKFSFQFPHTLSKIRSMFKSIGDRSSPCLTPVFIWSGLDSSINLTFNVVSDVCFEFNPCTFKISNNDCLSMESYVFVKCMKVHITGPFLMT